LDLCEQKTKGVNNFKIFNINILFILITNHYAKFYLIWMTFNFLDQIQLSAYSKIWQVLNGFP